MARLRSSLFPIEFQTPVRTLPTSLSIWSDDPVVHPRLEPIIPCPFVKMHFFSEFCPKGHEPLAPAWFTPHGTSRVHPVHASSSARRRVIGPSTSPNPCRCAPSSGPKPPNPRNDSSNLRVPNASPKPARGAPKQRGTLCLPDVNNHGLPEGRTAACAPLPGLQRVLRRLVGGPWGMPPSPLALPSTATTHPVVRPCGGGGARGELRDGLSGCPGTPCLGGPPGSGPHPCGSPGSLASRPFRLPGNPADLPHAGAPSTPARRTGVGLSRLRPKSRRRPGVRRCSTHRR